MSIQLVVIESHFNANRQKILLTCDKIWMCDPVGRIMSIVTQVSDLHVAIIDAENKGQNKWDEWGWFTSSD